MGLASPRAKVPRQLGPRGHVGQEWGISPLGQLWCRHFWQCDVVGLVQDLRIRTDLNVGCSAFSPCDLGILYSKLGTMMSMWLVGSGSEVCSTGPAQAQHQEMEASNYVVVSTCYEQDHQHHLFRAGEKKKTPTDKSQPQVRNTSDFQRCQKGN